MAHTNPPRNLAVMFDMDGTLVDSIDCTLRTYVDTISSLAGRKVTSDDIIAYWHIGPTPVLLSHFLGRPASPADVARYFDCFETAAGSVCPYPGIRDVLDFIDGEGIRMGVFTTATRRATNQLLTKTRLNTSFHTIICGDEVSTPKPAAEGLERACQQLGVRPCDTVYVGDTATDLQCARNAGTLSIYAAWGVGLAPEARSAPIARRPRDVIRILRDLGFFARIDEVTNTDREKLGLNDSRVLRAPNAF